jgi:hypothetical protein
MENIVSRAFAYWLARILLVVTSALPCILLRAVASRLCNTNETSVAKTQFVTSL